MGTYQSSAFAAFVEYARAQHTYGTVLAERHGVDGTGCCRECGRPYPCDLRRLGERLVAHYRQWIEPTRPRLVRPYVDELR